MAQTKETELTAYGIDVKKMGAAGDGVSDDSAAIQQALDSGQPLVAIPEGTYKIGTPLRVNSNTTLRAHQNARIIFADGAGKGEWDFLIGNKDVEKGSANITIDGGIWDGNNVNNPRGEDVAGSYSGTLMNFINVRDLILSRLTLTDSEAYYIRIGETKDFVVEHIHFESPNVRPNQDGVHLGGFCSDGTIRHISASGKGVTGDDLVALNADDNCLRTQNRNLKCGSIKRVRISDLKADDCHSFVRLLTVWSPIEDIDIEGLYGGCRVCVLNLDAYRDCRMPLFDSDIYYKQGAGYIENVTMRNIDVYKSGDSSSQPLLDLRSQMNGLTVVNFKRDNEKDKNPGAPTMRVKEVRPSIVRMCGLEESQVKAMADSAKNAEVLSVPMASLDEKDSFAAQYKLGLDSELVMPSGGFRGLKVDSLGTHK